MSQDTLVGPPDRVRWVAAATSEVEGMVTAGGRKFYGGILARDSFNGLRLWHRNLKTGEKDTVEFEFSRSGVPRENLLGPEEGMGFIQLMKKLQHEVRSVVPPPGRKRPIPSPQEFRFLALRNVPRL